MKYTHTNNLNIDLLYHDIQNTATSVENLDIKFDFQDKTASFNRYTNIEVIK